MPTNIVTTSLPDYVQENRDVLVKDIVLGARTIARCRKQTGVKGSAPLNLLDVSPSIVSGAGCAFEAAGSAALTQRIIETAIFKVNLEICPETLRGKWAEYLLRTNANGSDLPFEQYLIDGIRKKISEAMETIVWQSDTDNSGLIDGFLTIAGDDASVVDVNIASGKSAYEGLIAVYNAIPENALRKDCKIFVSPAIFRAFTQELVALNLFHVAVPNEEFDEVFLPGTGVKVIKTDGLANSLQVLATYEDNLYFGCDLESDAEVVKAVHDEKTDAYDIIAKWNAGVQFAFPDEVVLGVFAAAPVAPATNHESLAKIAANTENIKDYSTVLGNIKSDLDTVSSKSAGLDNLAGIKTAVESLDDLAGAYDGTNHAINTVAITPAA